jgi:hypothetical protein
MRRREIDAALAAANPVAAEEVRALELGRAEEELLDGIVAEGAAVRSRSVDGPSTQSARMRPSRLALAATALAAGLIAFFFLVSGGKHGQPTVRPTSAYAAELVRNVEASPRLLVGTPGWRVEGLQARFQEGEMQFGREAGPGAREAELTWAPASLVSLASRVSDRANSAELETTAPVLDTTAKVFQYLGSEPGHLDVTALWQEGELVVEYRAIVPTMADFEAQLASLRKVGADAWLAAMPSSVVKPAEFESAVRRMLQGIPLPPGFGPDDVMTGSVPTDRYQLAAGVASSVGCTWFARWAEARRDGDEQQVQAAVAAMSSVDTWPLIRQGSEEGAFDQVLTDLAEAMPRGSVYKDRPLEFDVESALGCGRLLGIEIPGSGSPTG